MADLHRMSRRPGRTPNRKAGTGRLVWIVAGGLGLALLLAGLAIFLLNRPGGTGGRAPEPAQVKRGASIYQVNCASCHGASGAGAPNWRIRNPDGTFSPPPHDNSGHTWHHGDGQLFDIVKNGGKVYSGPGMTSMMPGFGGQLSDQEIRDVIAFLKSLWGAEERQYQAEVSRNDPMP